MSTKCKWPSLLLGILLLASAPAYAQGAKGRPAAAAATNQVASFKVQEKEDGTYIRIRGSSMPTFSVLKLSDPPRLSVDLSNSELRSAAQQQAVRNGVISQVALVGVYAGGQSVARGIIGFEKPAHYDVRTDGSDVVIFIDGQGRAKKAPAERPERKAEYELALK